MNFEEYVAFGLGIFVALIIIGIVIWKYPKKIKHDYYVTRWKKVQDQLSDKVLWPQAIIEADDLLNEALKKTRFKGKNMGERMVDAQKNFTNNDAVWFGHKLRTKIELNPELKLTQDEVQKALFGLRQGLKDVGALK